MTEKAEKMIEITAGEEKLTVPAGTAYLEIARKVQEHYPHRIVLVKSEGRLRELYHTAEQDETLEMVTTADRQGFRTYERSAVFLMLKAFHDVAGRENFGRLIVDYSVSRNLFCRIAGSPAVDESLLEKVEAEMRRLSGLSLPIEKRVVSRDEAVRIFRRSGMKDKERLFRYRRSSWVNIYSLDGFEDYFYGYMVPDTSCIDVFHLELFQNGFLLRIPNMENPGTLSPLSYSKKVFDEMYSTTIRLDQSDLGTIAGLNDKIAAGKSREVILCQEALMEKKIGDIAEQIAARKNVRFVMIAGPSSSGKTTFSNRLSTQLRALGLTPHPLEVDNYFKNRKDTPKDETGQYDYECLGAMDVERFNQDMLRLMNGETVEIPHYNFTKGEREYCGDFLTVGQNDLLVIEGIHCLNDAFSHAIPAENKFRIYISCLTQMNVDEHNRIPTTDARFIRRMTRDARIRGTGARETIRRWPSVGRGEFKNIFPFQDSADVVFNSAMIYETAVMKPYVEALLFGIPEDCPEAAEAKRLLKFLDYFLTIPADDVPATSILREFIGGGCYKV